MILPSGQLRRVLVKFAQKSTGAVDWGAAAAELVSRPRKWCNFGYVGEFGLTGGIGSGKSAVSQRLAALGAAIVDADKVVRSLQQPGMVVFEGMVSHFGDDIVGADGGLDRAAVAEIVFNDSSQLKALNEIVHPAVRAEMADLRALLAQSHDCVVLDVPLLVESGYDDVLGVIVVDVSVDTALARLVEHRGFSENDARARMANQVDREHRLARADFIIDNEGGLDELDLEVDRCWAWMQTLL